ncbi:MAG: archease [Actinomycetota bacterium]
MEHTSDVGIRAYGGSMAEAFENCALGMMSLMLEPERVKPRHRAELSARGRDGGSLLVAWLSEILFKVEAEGWAFNSFGVVSCNGAAVAGWGAGEPLDAARHGLKMEIKAPTYHLLELGEAGGRWAAQVIFDV